jgi:hypothetical protein
MTSSIPVSGGKPAAVTWSALPGGPLGGETAAAAPVSSAAVVGSAVGVGSTAVAVGGGVAVGSPLRGPHPAAATATTTTKNAVLTML